MVFPLTKYKFLYASLTSDRARAWDLAKKYIIIYEIDLVNVDPAKETRTLSASPILAFAILKSIIHNNRRAPWSTCDMYFSISFLINSLVINCRDIFRAFLTVKKHFPHFPNCQKALSLC